MNRMFAAFYSVTNYEMDNLSKFIEDINFLKWVIEPTPELDLFWDRFQREHPNESNNIEIARKIIQQFRIDSSKLPVEDKMLLFSGILKKIEERQKSLKVKIFILRLLSQAAIALIFFSLGALLFYQRTNNNPDFTAFNTGNLIPENQAQLIRSNGENLILKEKKSIIEYKESGELIINRDTVKQKSVSSSNEAALNQLIIPFGKTSEVLLPDGTKVFLNAGSRLIYPDHFKAESRDVMLLGEAFFEVKHEEDRPFIVQVNDLRIKDLGTKFNISAYPSDNRTETVLTEGKVSIRTNNSGFFTKDTELAPGQLASFDRELNQIKVNAVKVDEYILWTTGIVKFESVDLSRIVKKLERFYNIRFQFDDPMLGSMKISGKLELNEDENEVIERIAHTANINIEKNEDNSYTIK